MSSVLCYYVFFVSKATFKFFDCIYMNLFANKFEDVIDVLLCASSYVCPSLTFIRVATVREKYPENKFFSRSGKSQGILWMIREI